MLSPSGSTEGFPCNSLKAYRLSKKVKVLKRETKNMDPKMSITAVTQNTFPRFHSQKILASEGIFILFQSSGSKWIASCFSPKVAILLWPSEIIHSPELHSHFSCLAIIDVH